MLLEDFYRNLDHFKCRFYPLIINFEMNPAALGLQKRLRKHLEIFANDTI